MKKRFFAFGCSLTKHNWSTWADVVALNFPESMNFGIGGASNQYIFDKFLEADLKYKFNPETDVVGVMLTGVNRFSWKLRYNLWRTNGDIQHILDQPDNPAYPAIKQFTDKMWNHNWAVHNTWIAAASIQNILKNRNIDHFILKGIDFDHYQQDYKLFGLDNEALRNIREVDSITLNKLALESLYLETGAVAAYFKKEDQHDGHPHPATHLEFVKQYLPQYVNPSIEEKFNYLSEGFYSESIEECKKIYAERRKELCLT
jgi:hypothetical protein